MLVSENWNSKAELSDVFRQGGDLLRRMSPGIAWVGSDRINGYAFGFGTFHQSQNARSLIRCQTLTFARVFSLGAARTTRFHFHIDLLLPKGCRRRAKGARRRQPVEPTAQRRLALLALDEET